MSTTPCEAPNKLWPGVKCTKVMNHEGLHHGTNSLGVMYEWKSDFETLLGQREHVHPHPNVPSPAESLFAPFKRPGTKPTVGRIVHYFGAGPSDPKAAIITKVTELRSELSQLEDKYEVSLCVFSEDGNSFRTGVQFARQGIASACWAWPKVER